MNYIFYFRRLLIGKIGGLIGEGCEEGEVVPISHELCTSYNWID